jgi:hypothetical protein
MERDALAQVRRPAAAYRDHGRLTLAATPDDARDWLVADWARADASGDQAHGRAMVALTRADDLNRRALDRLEATGVLTRAGAASPLATAPTRSANR